MRPGRRDLQAILRGERGQFAAKPNDLLPRTTSIGTYLGPELDHALVHLGFHLLFQDHFAAGKNLLNVRAQLARLRINDLEFFFDTESKDVIFRAHGSSKLKLCELRNRSAIAAWRLADDLPEDAIEMRERLKANVVGHFAHAAVAIEQQRLRFLNPNSRKIIGKR